MASFLHPNITSHFDSVHFVVLDMHERSWGSSVDVLGRVNSTTKAIKVRGERWGACNASHLRSMLLSLTEVADIIEIRRYGYVRMNFI
jgi:hypothetical protein